MKQYTDVLLNSGGMDSLLVASILKKEQNSLHLFCNVGQKYLTKERKASKYIADISNADWREVTVSNFCIHEDESGIIPFRNAELILNAAQYGNRIWLGVLAEEINSDKSPEFFEAITSVLNISHREQYWTKGEQFEIILPIKHLTKAEAITEYINAGNSYGHLLFTVSCYSGTEYHCGKCSSCFKRWVAITLATKKASIEHFENNPATWKTVEYWIEKCKGYNSKRAEEIMQALKYAGKL